MFFHKEGYKIIFGASLILALICFGVSYGLDTHWLGKVIIGIALIFYILILQFFRNPRRYTQVDENHIIAPADGKVVVIEETTETEYFKDKRIQVSIFMSPINVHVNRYPVTGKVAYQKYYKGKYLVAWHPKSSTENERTTVVVDSPKGSVLFRQIAGALARRIVCYAKEGQAAAQGEEFGFIKFGSRIDLFLPVNCKIVVNLNEKTVGGETVIAKFE